MRGAKAGRPIPPMSEADERRFWSRVALPDPETGCMEWLAGKNSGGYGQFRLGGSRYLTHRISWTLANGEIPAGFVLDHAVCRNKSCVNPSHLRICTVRDNNMASDGASRMLAEAQSAKTRCPAGHAYDEENTLVCRGRRYCRACRREQARAYYLRKKMARAA